MARYTGGIKAWWDQRKVELGRTDFGAVDYYDWLKENAPEDGSTGTKRWGDPDVTDLVWARNQFLNHLPNEELWEGNQRGKEGGLYARINHNIIQSWYTHKRGQDGVAERTRFSEADYLAALAIGKSSWDVRNWLGEHKHVDGAEKIFDALTENRKINIEQLYKNQFGDDYTINGDKVQAHLDSGKGLWDLKGDIESEHQIAEATAATEAANTTAQAIATTARTATLSEHVIQVDVSDLAEQSYGAGGSLGSNTGAVIGNAIAARLDNDLVQLFAAGSLTNDVAGAASTLDESDIFEALRMLHANQAPAPLNLVLGTQQVWGAKGLRLMVGSHATLPTTTNWMGGSAVGQEMVTSGFITKLAGFDVYSTPEIIEDGNNDEAGCAFSAGAFGFATGSNGIMSIETQRDASARVTEYVGTGVWGECMIKDLWAVSITSDVS